MHNRGRDASPLDIVLDQALITPPEHGNPAMLGKLDAIVGRVTSARA